MIEFDSLHLPDPGMPLVDALGELEQSWAHAGQDFTLLHSGITEHEVRSKLATIGITASRQTITWFGFHNGADRPFECNSAVHYLTLDQAIEHWTMIDDLADWEENPTARQWCPITFSNGDLMVIDNQLPDATGIASTDFGSFDGVIVKPFAEVVQWWTQLFTIGTTRLGATRSP